MSLVLLPIIIFRLLSMEMQRFLLIIVIDLYEALKKHKRNDYQKG